MNVVTGIVILIVVFLGQNFSWMENQVVARVGPYVITEKDLLDSYEFGPAFVKRFPDPLQEHLKFMIFERLIALEGKTLGYDTSLFVRERVAALEEDLAVEQLYRDEILTKAKLPDEEVGQGIQKAKTQVRFRWMYAKNVEDARRIENQLKGGIPFDSVFAHELGSSGNKAGYSLETNYLQLEYDNPEFAKMIGHLRNQEISEPLQGPDGYYIVRIDEIWQNPITRESEYETLRGEALQILQEIRADELAKDYVRTKMTAANPIIRAEGSNIVRAYLADKGLSRDKRLLWKIPTTFMTEAGPQPIQASGEFLHRPLVSFGPRTLTVGDYLRWFDIRQFQLKTHSVASFNSSVKRTIWKMVQDKLLSEEAYGRGLQQRELVLQETKKWEAKLLYLAGRMHLLKQLRITDDEVQQYFEKNRHRYRNKTNKRKDFGEVKQEVLLDLYYAKESLMLSQTLGRLQMEYPVQINHALLDTLDRHLEREGSLMNVIFYKPGGTFPRVAFPTIDEVWQRFPE